MYEQPLWSMQLEVVDGRIVLEPESAVVQESILGPFENMITAINSLRRVRFAVPREVRLPL